MIELCVQCVIQTAGMLSHPGFFLICSSAPPMTLSQYIHPLLLLAGLSAFPLTAYNQAAHPVKWVVQKDGTVKVDGSTNVNKFSCSISGYSNPDTLTCQSSSKDKPVAMTGLLTLPVASFDCMSAMMTNDLRKTLKAKQFPTLNISFVSLEKYPSLQTATESITGVVIIELSGVSKRVEVNYTIFMDGQKTIHLVGQQCIHFSDFRLTPPRKLGGMIRADDKLDVTFHINFKMVS